MGSGCCADEYSHATWPLAVGSPAYPQAGSANVEGDCGGCWRITTSAAGHIHPSPLRMGRFLVALPRLGWHLLRRRPHRSAALQRAVWDLGTYIVMLGVLGRLVGA